MNWPDYFPEGCPPDDAVEPAGVAYRLCQQRAVGGTAREKDFRPVRLLKGPLEGSDECCRCDISLDDNLPNLLAMRAEIAENHPFFARKVPAIGTMRPDWGLTKPTPTAQSRTHRSLWLYDGLNPYESFTVVAEPEVPDAD